MTDCANSRGLTEQSASTISHPKVRLTGRIFRPIRLTRIAKGYIRGEFTPGTSTQHGEGRQARRPFARAGTRTAQGGGPRSSRRANAWRDRPSPRDPDIRSGKASPRSWSCTRAAGELARSGPPLHSVDGRCGSGATMLATMILRDPIRVRRQLARTGGPQGGDRRRPGRGQHRRAARAGGGPASVRHRRGQRAKASVAAHFRALDHDPRPLPGPWASRRDAVETCSTRAADTSDDSGERRLEASAMRGAYPASAHPAIGLVAYGCSFTSRAHVARRFRAHGA